MQRDALGLRQRIRGQTDNIESIQLLRDDQLCLCAVIACDYGIAVRHAQSVAPWAGTVLVSQGGVRQRKGLRNLGIPDSVLPGICARLRNKVSHAFRGDKSDHQAEDHEKCKGAFDRLLHCDSLPFLQSGRTCCTIHNAILTTLYSSYKLSIINEHITHFNHYNQYDMHSQQFNYKL